MTQRKSRRQLTPEAFGKFLEWLSGDNETAVDAYQSLRRRLIRYFGQKACADPEQLFDETVDIMMEKIEQGGEEIVNPIAYCFGIARNVWLQDVRKRRSVSMDGDFASPEPQEPSPSEQELECLERCVRQLPPSDRVVITRYHRSQGSEKIETRKVLAAGLGGMNALRIKVCRIRKELRSCVVDCVNRSARGKFR